MIRKVGKVMYCKFNAQDKRRRMVIKNKKGMTIIDKPFKEVLQEEIDKTDKQVTTESDSMDEIFIWKCAFDNRKEDL